MWLFLAESYFICYFFCGSPNETLWELRNSVRHAHLRTHKTTKISKKNPDYAKHLSSSIFSKWERLPMQRPCGFALSSWYLNSSSNRWSKLWISCRRGNSLCSVGHLYSEEIAGLELPQPLILWESIGLCMFMHGLSPRVSVVIFFLYG